MKTAIKTTIQVGSLIYTRVTTRRQPTEKKTRAQKRNKTSEEVMRINDRYAERDLSIKLHHNFNPGDYHIVLTYAGQEPTHEEARKKLDKFKRDLAKEYKKAEKELKWIEVTEYLNKRIHHHLIISKHDLETIRNIWPHGHIRVSMLDKTRDWRRLVSYLIKETTKTFREKDSYAKRRYRCSRTLEAPEIRTEEVSAVQLFEVKATKGYYIDNDTVYKGINLAVDKPYIEYVQVAESSDHFKKYKRGKKGKYKKDKYINPSNNEYGKEEQLSLL